ncbi:MAG TPA: putative Ig domain-containing protein, partial [Gaiellaceae bacterium]|nr:putative Ig domain-containing protein [Gaiellaceae bacterium]
MPCREHRRRALIVLVVALAALVIVPSAAAIRFTDESYKVPDGAVGSRYYHQFQGDGGCGPALPYQFRILNGSLPLGLTLASNGLVSGIPTQGGNWSFWVELSDQDPPTAEWCIPRKSEREFTINIGPRGSVPDASPPASSSGGGGGLSVPNPCELPVVGNVCDAVAGAVTKVAAEAGEFVMRGVTAWVTNAAVWVTGKVGELIERTSTPDLRAGWFEGQYGAMVAAAGALALLMLLLAVIQSVIRQDVWMLVRAAFGYLPMAFILAGVAIAGAGLLVAITDDMSSAVVSSLGTDQSDNLLQAVGDAYKRALDEDSGIPLFGVFLGAIILALGAFVL